MPKRLKKLSEEVLHENPWWKYKHDTYEKPNGEAGDYFYGETLGVAIIVPVRSDGRLLLTIQHRYLVDKQSIEFPGGGVLEGMKPIDAARKELYEETGWLAKDLAKVGEFQPANGFIKDLCHVFIATIVDQQEAQPDDTEEFELLYRRPDEIEQMIVRNDIWDGQAMASWSLVRHIFLKEQMQTSAPAFQGLIENFLDMK